MDIAITIHFEQNGVPMCLLLDLVEVTRSHSGMNLASAFVKILDDFRIVHKVSLLDHLHEKYHAHCALMKTCVCDQKLYNNPASLLDLAPQRSCK